MEITQSRIDAAYAVADDNQKKVLDALFGNDTRPVTERIKSFEDACRELGISHPFVKTYANWGIVDGEEDVDAYFKLRIIVAALNEGWEPKFVCGEYRWIPYFTLYTNEKLEDMNDDDKKNICRVVGRSNDNASACGGIAYTSAHYASSSSSTGLGSRLAFKSKELAIYAGQQFIQLYRDFMIQLHQ